MWYFTNEEVVTAKMCLLMRQQCVLWPAGKFYVEACTCPLASSPVLAFLISFIFIVVGKVCGVHCRAFAPILDV